MKILIVDDQRSARRVLREMLRDRADVEIAEASTIDEANAAIGSFAPDLMLLDVRLSDDPRDRGGLDLLRSARARGVGTPVIMVTCATELAEIREAMRSGAQDYILKDELCPEMLLPVIDVWRERRALRAEVTELREKVERTWGVAAIAGSSPAMDRLRKLVKRVAESDATVLIRGDTGTGKELVARAIHQEGSRRNEPFIAINCSALPGTLIESLLFGHERGAFTGAERRTRGQFELARGGTLFLDEVAEMSAEAQAKLLRVLEDRKFRPLGSETEITVRARVLAATHVSLERRMAEGRFREDLFYRLNVVSIQIPPLAERVEDLPDLLNAFTAELGRKIRFDKDAIAWLARRAWNGNLRELRNLVERLALLSETDDIGVAELTELAEDRRPEDALLEVDRMARTILTLPDRLGCKLHVIERAILHHAIETTGGNKSAAARILGIERRALERRWDRLGDGGEGDES